VTNECNKFVRGFKITMQAGDRKQGILNWLPSSSTQLIPSASRSWAPIILWLTAKSISSIRLQAIVLFTHLESISAYRRFIEIIIHLFLCAFKNRYYRLLSYCCIHMHSWWNDWNRDDCEDSQGYPCQLPQQRTEWYDWNNILASLPEYLKYISTCVIPPALLNFS